MLKKSKKGLKGFVVTSTEHAKWHKENGDCGTGKEHEECHKKWGITIAEKKS